MVDSPIVVSLKDPLSQVSRSERKMLLGSSAISIFVASTGLVPTKISALGVEFGQSDQRAFLIVMALIVAYFLCAFVVYGLTDYLAWRVSYDDSRRAVFTEFHEKISGFHPEIRERERERFAETWIPNWPKHLVRPAALIRGGFDFVLPILVGAFAVYILLQEAA